MMVGRGMWNNRIAFIAIGAVIGIGVAFGAVYNFQTQEITQIPAVAITDEKYLPSGTNSWMYPGEPLPPDEMRITVMGTSAGYVRHAQAGQSFFVELGNGDTFMFDAGEGSEANYMKMQIPYSKMDTVFLTHLHMDHTGSLPHIYGFGPSADRFTPMNIYGPSGDTPELGTKSLVEGMKQYTNWHVTSFKTAVPESDGFDINVHEFDYTLNPGIAYDKNGVVIKHFPASHTMSGAVNYRIEWNGLCAILPSDTRPSMFDIENGQDCDIIFHEVGPDPKVFSEKMNMSIEAAKLIVDNSHTNAKGLGKIFAETQPRMGVVVHAILNQDTLIPIVDSIREYYDGPLRIANDLMVFNISHDEITQRMGIGSDSPWVLMVEKSPKNPPEFDLSDYKNSYLIENEIPPCEDAVEGQLCY
jgi:ribonuclease Z